MIISSIIGVFGLLMILMAFAFNLFHFLSQRSIPYNLLNILGSAMLAYYAIILSSIPFLILQIVWGLLSIIKLIHVLNSRNKGK
jgi:hypothetical protein